MLTTGIALSLCAGGIVLAFVAVVVTQIAARETPYWITVLSGWQDTFAAALGGLVAAAVLVLSFGIAENKESLEKNETMYVLGQSAAIETEWLSLSTNIIYRVIEDWKSGNIKDDLVCKYVFDAVRSIPPYSPKSYDLGMNSPREFGSPNIRVFTSYHAAYVYFLKMSEIYNIDKCVEDRRNLDYLYSFLEKIRSVRSIISEMYPND